MELCDCDVLIELMDAEGQESVVDLDTIASRWNG